LLWKEGLLHSFSTPSQPTQEFELMSSSSGDGRSLTKELASRLLVRVSAGSTYVFILKQCCRIHDNLVWIRIRIRGFMFLTIGSGFGSCYFSHHFSYYFCLMIEGSGSARSKNMLIRWIRIRIAVLKWTCLTSDECCRLLCLGWAGIPTRWSTVITWWQSVGS
jgi:hypothetical protein